MDNRFKDLFKKQFSFNQNIISSVDIFVNSMCFLITLFTIFYIILNDIGYVYIFLVIVLSIFIDISYYKTIRNILIDQLLTKRANQINNLQCSFNREEYLKDYFLLESLRLKDFQSLRDEEDFNKVNKIIDSVKTEEGKILLNEILISKKYYRDNYGNASENK